MYTPAHFAEPDPRRVRTLIEAHSFGLLVVPRPTGAPEIAHLPFLLDGDAAPGGVLRAHVARANPLASALLADDLPVVAVFAGPHGYVSPAWYAEPATSVPTWNYEAVHVHGTARAVRDRGEARRTLRDLTARFEAGSPAPWTVDGADDGYVEKLLGGIVAFAIPIERVEAKAKLSQNRSAEDRARVARALRARGGPDDIAMAARMEAMEPTAG